MKIKKAIAIMLLISLALSSLFAEGAKETYAKETAPAMRVYKDSLGREVTIPANVESVAPSGNVAQLAIYAVAPDKMVGWSSKLSDAAMATFLPEIAKLPTFGTFYGKKANLNKEALIAANPDVVIDVGEIKGGVEAMTKQLDALSAEIGIPVIFVEGYFTNADEMFISLGDILGKEKEAKALSEYTRKAMDAAEDNKDKLAYSFYYSSAQDGLSAIESGSFHAEVIEYAGLRNVVPSTFSKSNANTSLENLFVWDPDVILLSSEAAVKNALSDKAWSELRAVKDGRIYLVPTMPYSFLDTPPATNRIIGIYWLIDTLVDDATVDIEKEVKEYYSLFYHKNLTDSELKAILK